MKSNPNPKKSNLSVKLLAILMALALWIYVSGTQNPSREQTLTDVPIAIRNLPPKMAVISVTPETLDVRIRGRGIFLTMIDKEALAFIDLEGFRSGKFMAEVDVSIPPGMQLVRKTPPAVEVLLAPVSSSKTKGE